MPKSQAPLFTIIVPTYNPGAKLRNTIDSVLAAPDGLAELVVIDGASDDSTCDLLRSYGDRLRFRSEPDAGLYDAMNKGIAISRGRFINFQGAGDVIRRGALSIIANHVPDSTPALVYGRVFEVRSGRVNGEKFSKMTLRNGNIPHQAVFYSRDLFDVCGTFDLQYPILADYALCLRCYGNESISKHFVDTVISDYEGGGISTTRRDAAFYSALPGLIRDNLGERVYWTWKAQKLVPLGLRRTIVAIRQGGHS
jgi:glycosyltransferase involved in cell wall biosynthesis